MRLQPWSYRDNREIESLGYGANPYAWLPGFSNPLFNAFGRMGYVPIMNWQITHGDNKWVNPSLMVIGLPGVQSGQSIMQPLSDTRKGVNGL